MKLAIAGVRVEVASTDPSLVLAVPRAAHDFLDASSEAPDLALLARWRDLTEEDRGPAVFDSGGVWQSYEREGSRRVRFVSAAAGPVPYKVASLDLARRSGEVWLHRPCYPAEGPIDVLEHPLDELLYNQLLADRSGLLLHACGVGDGDVFIAHSGGGKSTLAQLFDRHAPHVRVLSDERIAVRRHGDRWTMYGTPWSGEAGFAANGEAPLRRLVFLEHGPADRLESLSGAALAARLFACSFPPFDDPARAAATLALAAELAVSVPAFRFTFAPRAAALVALGYPC